MRHKAGTVCIAVGTVLLLAALSLLAYNRWDDWRAGQSVENTRAGLEEAKDAQKDDLNDLYWQYRYYVPDGGVMPAVEIDGYEYIGTLSIPQFGLELPVMSEWSYPGLRIAPGRYTGSVWTDDLIICGHNYERHFGNLRDLDPGDAISFTDVLGNVFEYEVAEIETLQPTAISEMKSGDWDLTLFTCTIGGRYRVTVRCMRV